MIIGQHVYLTIILNAYSQNRNSLRLVDSTLENKVKFTNMTRLGKFDGQQLVGPTL